MTGSTRPHFPGIIAQPRSAESVCPGTWQLFYGRRTTRFKLREEENETAEVPEIFKPFVWAWYHSRRNRELLTKPPVLGLSLVTLMIGFFAGNWHRADVTEVLRET